MYCKHNDCGWCYAPKETLTNSEGSQCKSPEECPETTKKVSHNGNSQH
jgi:hypothetical protein